jgi:hypothetical protein
MRTVVFLAGVMGAVWVARAQDVAEQARRLERAGDVSHAESLLRQAASPSSAIPQVLEAHAEFLDRHGNVEARAAYERLLGALKQPDDNGKRAVARRLVLLSLQAGDRTAAAKYLRQYREAGGKDWAEASLEKLPAPAARETIEIPGPLSSFKRMAGISQDAAGDEVLLGLARSIVNSGYHAGHQESLEPTEYLKLITRYLSQARELEKLAGDEKTIRVESCDSPQTGELLRVLGYRMRGGCGSDVVVETVNATRSFLTIDSGFPLSELEQALRTNRPFTYDYRPAVVPVMATAGYWLGTKDKPAGEFIDAFLADPALCRFYLGMSKPEPGTAEELRKTVPAQRLRAFAHVLDFFGGMFEIRNGKAVVPGGARTARMWDELVGVSPDKGAAFFERLITKDDGWMASFFDALARIDGPVKDYLTEPERMKRFYMAIRGRVTSPGPARPVFRSNTEMLLLTTRLRLEPNGSPHIPGGIDVWRGLFMKPPRARYDIRLTRLAGSWKEPDDVLEALFALCRKGVGNEPLTIFMAITDVNRGRTRPLEAATVDRLVREYSRMGSQYSIFSEAPFLSDKTILQFLDTAAQTGRISDGELRTDVVGTLQATVGLWQILCRLGAIPASEADAALSAILSNLARPVSSRELFEAGRANVSLLLKAARSQEGASPQDRIVDLLSGAGSQADPESRRQAADELLSYFEAQHLASLSLLFEVADHIDSLPRGGKPNAQLIGRIAAKLAEIEAPRATLTSTEKNAAAFSSAPERHIEEQRRLDLRAAIDRAGTDPEKLRDVKGRLAPVLRDTLVGLNYIYYAPPGAQLLRTNPLFVRSHDFQGQLGNNPLWREAALYASGWPYSVGGRLVGSLAGLPYALADAEQNFLVPSRQQALIWGDLVPQLILCAKVPRWWDVSASEMHWVGLHLRYGASLIAEAVLDPPLRLRVLEALGAHVEPARVDRIAQLLETGDVPAALVEVTPSELFALAKDTLARGPGSRDILGDAIRRLASEAPDRVNYAAISRAFGTPKPTLTNSYGSELLCLRTLPALMGYSSRIMAESWESNTIYWAALADEMYLAPAQMNVLIPQWTQQTVERIFATHLEDWPSLYRSLRYVGEEVRRRARQQTAGEQKASLE